MMWFPTLLLIGFALEPLGGLDEEWLGPGQSDRLARITPMATNVRLLWQRPVIHQGSYGQIVETFGQPAIDRVNKRVFVGTSEGSLAAFTLHHGQEIWRYGSSLPPMDGGAALINVPGQQQPWVCFTGRTGRVICLASQDGRLMWQQQLGGAIRGPVQYVPKRGLLVQTHEAQIVLLDLQKGHLLWQYTQPIAPSLRIDGQARMWVEGERCFAGLADGSLVALALENGQLLWHRAPERTDDLFVDADADPQWVQGILLAGLYHAGILALEGQDGSLIWRRNVPGVVRMAYGHGLGIGISAEGYVWAFDVASGQLRWRIQFPKGRVSRLSQMGQTWLMTHSTLGLVAFHGHNGRPLVQLSMVGMGGQDLAVDGDLMASVSLSGHLHLWQQL